MSEQHDSPIKTPQQLVWIVVLSFVVPIFVIVLLVKYVVGAKVTGAGSDATGLAWVGGSGRAINAGT